MIDKQQERDISVNDVRSKQLERNQTAKSTLKASKGEKTFDLTAYTGLNYFVNLISSVAIADYFVNGKGRKGLDSWINKSAEILHKASVPLKTAHHNSKIALETSVLLSGGMLLLIPLKIMEDNKRKIVHKINKKLGVNQQAEDGHEKTADEIHIEKEQPKQSWGHVIWRRVIGTVAVIGAGMGIDHFLRNEKKILPQEKYKVVGQEIIYDTKVQGGKQRVEEGVFGFIDKAVKSVRGKSFAKNGIVSRWTKLAILDSVFTIITAVVMKVTSGAKKAKTSSEIDNSNDPLIVKTEINKITTADDVEKNKQLFSEKIGKRIDKLVDARAGRADVKHSFVETVQQKDAPAIGVGV